MDENLFKFYSDDANFDSMRDVLNSINMDQIGGASFSSPISLYSNQVIDECCERLTALQGILAECRDPAAMSDAYSEMTGILAKLERFSEMSVLKLPGNVVVGKEERLDELRKYLRAGSCNQENIADMFQEFYKRCHRPT